VHGFIMGLIQDLNNATKKRKQKKKTSRNWVQIFFCA
jgi:hypothetical protein